MPGSRASSAISSSIAPTSERWDTSERWEGKRLHLPHFGLQQIGGATLRLGHGREHEVREELRIVLLEDAQFNAHPAHLAPSIGICPYQSAARRRFDRPVGELGLQLLQ